MTKEEKQLLLKDLCARLPYGVMLNIDYYDLQGDGKLKNRDVILSYGNIGYCSDNTNWVSVKPYLRPMLSMTKEEKFDIGRLLVDYGEGLPTDMYIDEVIDNSIVIDYLLEHHFDYRSLIEKGLALPAPPDMYNK